jgi:hypothetical protein
MTDFINAGAYVNNQRPKSKKALREALKSNPETVVFDSTALMGPRAGENITPGQIGEDEVVSVTGPDPYRDRKWYASVKATARGVTIT